MKNKILAAQQEDAARRLIQMVLTREGLSPVEDPQALEKNGERMVVVTYQVSITDSGSTAPVQTITMAARPEDLLAHTGGLQMDDALPICRWTGWSLAAWPSATVAAR